MKFQKLMLFSFLMALALPVFAQRVELTVEEWEKQMNDLRAKKESLSREITSLQSDVNNLKSTLQGIQSYDDCMKDLYSLVGADQKAIDDFRAAVNNLEGKIRRKEGPKADRQRDLDALKMNKISALPEFYNRVHVQMQKMLDEWVEVSAEVMYTVVKGDHLWGIARKKEHYGNGFAWPKIYNANRDKIKNPDLIYPKQVFKIPELTAEEKAKYEKARKNYKPAPTQ